MPFKSQKQRAACWAQYNRDTAAGKKPKWDCKEWEEHSPSRLPTYKKGGRSRSKSRKSSKRKSRKPSKRGSRKSSKRKTSKRRSRR